MATAEEVALYYPLPDRDYLQAELQRLQADFQAFQDRIAQDQAGGQGTDCICFDDDNNNHAAHGTGDNEPRDPAHGGRDDQHVPEDNGGDLSAAGLRSALDRLTRRATALLDTQDGWACPCAERPGVGAEAATGAGVEAVETQAEGEEEDLSSDLFGSNDHDDDDSPNDGDGNDGGDDGDEEEEEEVLEEGDTTAQGAGHGRIVDLLAQIIEELPGDGTNTDDDTALTSGLDDSFDDDEQEEVMVEEGDPNTQGARHGRIADLLAQIIEELPGGLTNPDIDISGFDDDDDVVVDDDQGEEQGEEEGEKTTRGAAGHGRITNPRGGYIIQRVTGDGTNTDYDTTLTSGLDDSFIVDENSVDWSAYEEEAIGKRGDDRSENTGDLGEWE